MTWWRSTATEYLPHIAMIIIRLSLSQSGFLPTHDLSRDFEKNNATDAIIRRGTMFSSPWLCVLFGWFHHCFACTSIYGFELFSKYLQEELEDIKCVNNDLQNVWQETKDRAARTSLKIRCESGVPKEWVFPDTLVALVLWILGKLIFTAYHIWS